MAAYGLYTHIQSNKRRSVALLVSLFLLVYLLVYAGALAGEAFSDDASLQWLLRRAWRDFLLAAPWATIGTAVWIVFAYYFHQNIIDAVTGGHAVTRKEQPRLYNLLENLCISRGIPMPALKVMQSDALNAFATGMNEKQYAITVTTGLLGRLDDAETEAVLGHELTHVRNGDVRMMVIAVVIAGVIAFFAELLFRMWFNTGFGWRSRRSDNGDSSDRGKGGAGAALLIAAVLIALAWLLSALIRFALSRSREFLADAGSVELTKNPDAMISALRKIEGRGELPGATSAVMNAFAASSGGRDDLLGQVRQATTMSAVGTAGPAVIGGALLLAYKVALALFVGFALRTLMTDRRVYARAQRLTGSAKNAAKGTVASEAAYDLELDVDRGFSIAYVDGKTVVVPNGKLPASALS